MLRDGRRRSSAASAIGAAADRARHDARLDHPAAGAARLRRQQRVEVTRWRGLIAAGFVAVALLGVGLEVAAARRSASPLAAIVLDRRLVFVPAAASARSRARPPKPLARDASPTAGAASSSTARGRSAIGAPSCCWCSAVPVLGLRLGFSDEGNFAEDTTTRQAYDLLAEGFGPGFNGPLLLVAEVAGRRRPRRALDAVAAAVAADPGVAVVVAADPQRPAAPTPCVLDLIPTDRPAGRGHDRRSSNRLRDDVAAGRDEPAPASTSTSPARVAVNIDFTDYLGRAACPFFFAAVLTLSFLLLMVVFRSLLVPLKAVIMNLLSIGAAYGVVVAVFQWGWLQRPHRRAPAPDRAVHPDDAVRHRLRALDGLRGVPAVPGPGGVRPHRRRRTSVADGLAATAQVITAAAAIMVVVFGSFMLEDDRVAQAVRPRPGRARSSSTPPSSACCSCRPRWSCSATGTGGCRAGSTGSCPTIDVEGHIDEPDRELVTTS